MRSFPRWRRMVVAVGLAAAAALLAVPVLASSGMSVQVWTDRGADAVYQPGESIEVKARSTDDAHLLVYDIDAEGYVHVLFPVHGETDFVSGRETLNLPGRGAGEELVVSGPVGQGYVVALASRAPLRDLPWYLRPYDPQASGVGYVGAPDEEEGITSEGRIVGDPFVAMERIRRRVLDNPEDNDSFAGDYATYYVHDRVQYPRYVCYDCHRPGYWAWWDGFDPYYASCSAFDFRVNYNWYWGRPYWSGFVPYYVFVVRPSCPPFYRSYVGTCYSSWDGWGRWNQLWGSHLRRYKSPPPPGYVSPARFKDLPRGRLSPTPPGFLAVSDSRRGFSPGPVARNPAEPVIPRSDWRPGGERRVPVGRVPAVETPGGDNGRGNGPPGRGNELPNGRPTERREPAGGVDNNRGGNRNSRPEGRPWWSNDSPRGGGRDAQPPVYAPRRPEGSQGRGEPPHGRGDYAPPERPYAPRGRDTYAPPARRDAPPPPRYEGRSREGRSSPPPGRSVERGRSQDRGRSSDRGKSGDSSGHGGDRGSKREKP